MHRWVKVPEMKLDEFIESSKIDKSVKEFGQRISDDASDNVMYEFHVDISELFWEFIENKEFGGDLSINFPRNEKVIITFGQDESAIDQNLYSFGSWAGPNGETTCLPKDRGLGIMISAFVSREFGFGFDMTIEQLDKVNRYRQHPDNCKYSVRSVCDLLDINVKKEELTETPFVQFFEFGATREGYWRNEHICRQFEDCIDCIRALHGDKYEYIFLFDHSSGHNKMMDGALNANDVNVNYGGAKNAQKSLKLPESEIKAGANYQIGDIQSMAYDEIERFQRESSHYGPKKLLSVEREYHRDQDREHKYVWLNSKRQLLAAITNHFAALRSEGVENVPIDPTNLDSVSELRGLALKWDIISAKILKPLSIKEIQVDLKMNDLKELLRGDGRDDSGNSYLRIKRRCLRYGLPTTKLVKKGHIENWWGKPKGMFQILAERGKVDISQFWKYSKDGKKDDNDNAFSLKEMLANCTDFKEAISIMQFIARERGVRIMSSPRYHCELAGEGIEYLWGYAKGCYRRIPLSRKNTAETFRQCLKDVFNSNCITVQRARRFSKRARRYICCYYVLHNLHEPPSTTMGENEEQGHSENATYKTDLKDIENLVQGFKSHRCALDFDRKFIKKELDAK